jgi:hypothetical protein
MRLGLAFAVGASASIAGCTFLIGFDELPRDAGEEETSIPAETGGPVPEAAPKDDAEAGAPPFPPPCDPTFPNAQVGCNGATRPTCAKTTSFTSYPAGYDRTNDLVLCNGGPTPSCVQHCPFGCTQTPAGFSDQCDDCNGRENGFYCGRDLRGWEPATSDLAVECVNGRTVAAAICGPNKCASKCTRTPGPRPSCCVP